MDTAICLFGDLELFETQTLQGDAAQDDTRDGPLTILRATTISLLSTMLNPIKVIPTESGLPRDWRGLAELGGLTAENITYLDSKSNSTHDLLKLLPSVPNSRLKTVKDLKAFLCIIDRYDVVDEAESVMEMDIQFYRSRLSHLKISKSPSEVHVNTSDQDLLTYGDIGGQTVSYDAFLLNADEDSEFANEVVRRLEMDYNLKLCVKERDLLPGVMFEYEAIGKLIEQRCNRLLVILSPSFLESEGNKFLVSFTQALALESRTRKIIPLLYKRCELPLSVRYSFHLDYNRAGVGTLWNFWEKLNNSIVSSPQENAPTNQPIRVQHLTNTTPTSHLNSTSLPDYSHWDSEKLADLTSPLELLTISNPSKEPLSSSVPQYSSKSSSKKWYNKVIGGGKKKKGTSKKSSKKMGEAGTAET